eukprot:m.1354889 g.1354889  ORF g.1354889 m.1354889 type:complete len:51 (-) comp24932_c0_seq24:250-402(-)
MIPYDHTSDFAEKCAYFNASGAHLCGNRIHNQPNIFTILMPNSLFPMACH